MADPATTAISIIALAVSITTAWLTLLRRGTVKMSQPTVIFFGFDTSPSPAPKVFLRTLLFATSKRGRIIESMHVALSRSETHQNFNIWVYGDEKLVRGSGLFVGENGVAANHHFLAPHDAHSFSFAAGIYRLDVYAHLLGATNTTLLFSQSLEITVEIATQLRETDTGLYFDWGPDSSRYIPHVDKRARTPTPETFVDRLVRAR
jgi:hypothetical protein